jgi:1-phosphatidylinositol-4-phosphate 5-kinase
MRESDPKKLGDETIKLPEEDTGDRQSLIFYQDEGGLRATDEANEPMSTIYYLGVIDILTLFNRQEVRALWEGSVGWSSKQTHLSVAFIVDWLVSLQHKISPVEPEEYENRFFCFMKAIMRGGGGGESFKPE